MEHLIAGVDEVGRGPLAGPVVAAAVILPPGHGIVGLADSKKLTEKKREALYDEIVARATAYAIAAVEHTVIDQINIFQASLLAMQRAVAQLSVQPHFVQVDGQHTPKLPCPSEAIIKGDQKIACISAASIIAKVARDRQMVEFEQVFPGYGFAQHKGYGTKQHLAALAQQGPCAIHRQSFSPVAAAKRKLTTTDAEYAL